MRQQPQAGIAPSGANQIANVSNPPSSPGIRTGQGSKFLIRSRAPLRLGLAGGGTDVSPYCDEYGGAILNATVDMYAYAIIEPTDDGRVVILATDVGQTFEADAAEPTEIAEPLILHRAVYRRIVSQFNDGRPLSCRLTTFCDAPPGSGLGTSSTLVVALVKAFVEWLNLPLGDYEIAHLAFEIERLDAGLLGGRQDQYAAAFGGVNFIEFYANDRVIVNPLRVKSWIMSELETSLVLFDSGVSRSSARIIEEQTAHIVANDPRPLEATHELKADAYGMKESLLRGNFSEFGALMRKSWVAKKKLAASISTQHIEQIYESAMEAGATAGKVSGAGGGGFLTFLVDPARRVDVVRALEKQSGRVMICHLTNSGRRGLEGFLMRAILLAGGAGTRLRTMVSDVPKPLAPVAGRPFLSYLLDLLERRGVEEVVLSVGYLHRMIIDAIGTHHGALSIRYAIEDEPLGTGGGLRNALTLAGGFPVFALNADTLLDLDYRGMHQALAGADASFALAVRRVADTGRYGRAIVEDGKVVGFETGSDGEGGLINAGVYLFAEDVLQKVTTPRVFSFERDFLEPGIADLRPLAYPTDKYFIDIGVPEDYRRAQRELPDLFRVIG